jgi:hypothetical protein
MDFSFLDRGAAGRLCSNLLRPRIFATVACLLFLASALHAVLENAQTSRGRKDFLEGDTGHYLAIASDFARGDFSMTYVRARPHRQPLYPLLLAPVMRVTGENLAALAAVNVALVALTFLLVYFGLLHRLRSRVVAATVGVLFLLNPFVHAQATQHLLTEPLHLLLMMGILFSLWDYLETRRTRSLAGAAALAGLDYLARPNGLFVMMAMTGTVLAVEIHRAWRAGAAHRRLSPVRGALRFALAGLAFVLISAPSWVPRCIVFGNPIYHGYLSNYLWVDTYAKAHVGQEFATYTAHDYFATHGPADIAKRWLRGLWECGFVIPAKVEGHFPVLFLLTLGGVGVTLWRGPLSHRALALFGGVQALPLIWTNLSNPTVRVPYAATIPFELIFAAIGLQCALRILISLRKSPRHLDDERRFLGGGRTQGNAPAMGRGDLVA